MQELGHCLKTVQMQEKELTTLQSQLSQTKTALTAANIKNDDLKQSLDEITLHLKKRVCNQQILDFLISKLRHSLSTKGSKEVGKSAIDTIKCNGYCGFGH